jgi:putative addiction module component (TIGR02574 family)
MLEAKEILEAALALEPAERARLAKQILDSLEGPVEVEPELAEDIQRRIREIESGAVEAIPWAQVKARIASRRRGD